MSEIALMPLLDEKKVLYDYQNQDIDKIFERIDNAGSNYHLLYQLPTGGGKTVIFSEITRRYLEKHDKKVVVLTHRIELCKQTSKMLTNFDVKNKVINGLYLQWGYNTEWYTKSNIHFRDLVNGVNHDFTIYKAKAHDRNDLDAITKKPIEISIPQYNYRIGFYLNAKKNKAKLK